MTLREARHNAQLTQDQLAHRSGVDQSTISDLETGRITDPRLSTLTRLAEALGIAPSDLRFSEPQPAMTVDPDQDRAGQTHEVEVTRR